MKPQATLRQHRELLARAQIRGLIPALGPIVGWTRYRSGHEATARVWILPNQMTSDPPVVALTAQLEGGAVKYGSVKLWKLFEHRLDGAPAPADPGERWAPPLMPAAHFYAVVDLDFDSPHTVFWIVALHIYEGYRYPGKPGGVQDIVSLMGTSARAGAPEGGLERKRIADLWKGIAPLDLIHGLHGNRNAFRRSIKPSKEAQQGTIESIARELQRPNTDDLLCEFAEAVRADLAAEFEAARRRSEAPLRRMLSRSLIQPKDPADCEISLTEAVFRPIDELPIRFATGTCRYPGIGVDANLADRALQELAAATGREDAPRFALFVGDQVYVDSFNGVFDVKDRLEKFTSCYQQAFGSTWFKALARRLPLYMVADDHEIKDFWPASLADVATRSLALADVSKQDPYGLAWRAYVGHQHAYAPPVPARWAATYASPEVLPLWYEFSSGPLAFFVLDTRFERELRRDDAAGGLMSPSQWQALFEFLARRAREQHQGQAPYPPTFIVSGAVFAPGLRQSGGATGSGRRSDTWEHFPVQRAELAAEIARLQLQNVVFLSGDYHCAAVGSLAFADDPGLRTYAIVAPALYAPMPFLNKQAQEVTEKDRIDPANGDAIVCRGDARDVCGYATISVQRLGTTGHADDWSIDVNVYEPEWSRPGVQAPRRARLEKGRAYWL